MRNNKNNSKKLRALNVALIDFGVRPTKDQSITIQAEKYLRATLNLIFSRYILMDYLVKICV